MDQEAKPPVEPVGPHGKVIAKYKVYWNRPSKKRSMVLQFPNEVREKPYNEARGKKPSEIRIKPNSSLVEVDVPLQVSKTFDKQKGLEYGKALKKSKVLQQGGSYGLAGGFGMSSQTRTKKEDQDAEQDEDDETSPTYFDEAKSKDSVMEKVTLGGRMSLARTGGPIYAIGVFTGST